MPTTIQIPTPHPVTLVGEEWIGPATPVVFAHGGGQTRHSWGASAERLNARGHRTLIYDQRGHGDSSWHPNEAYRFDDFAADAPAVIAAVGGRAAWVGASLGGMAGILAAGGAVESGIPHEVAALVLVDITHHPRADGVSRILEFMRADLEDGFASLEDAAAAVAAYQPHRRQRAEPEGLRKNLRLGDDGRWRWHWDPAFMPDRGPGHDRDRYQRLEAALRAVRCPILLVRGRLSDLVTDDEVAAFREVAPDADVVDVSGAAHMVAGDRNDVFSDAVSEWLDGCDL